MSSIGSAVIGAARSDARVIESWVGDARVLLGPLNIGVVRRLGLVDIGGSSRVVGIDRFVIVNRVSLVVMVGVIVVQEAVAQLRLVVKSIDDRSS